MFVASLLTCFFFLSASIVLLAFFFGGLRLSVFLAAGGYGRMRRVFWVVVVGSKKLQMCVCVIGFFFRFFLRRGFVDCCLELELWEKREKERERERERGREGGGFIIDETRAVLCV